MLKNIWKIRQREMLLRRQSEPLTQYRTASNIEPAGFSEDLLFDVSLKHLRGYLYEPSLTILPDDNIHWLIGIDDDEITDVMEKIIVDLGEDLPDRPILVEDIKTVGDMVNFIGKFIQSRKP